MAAAAAEPSSEDGVLVLAPVARDATVVCQTLSAAGIACIAMETLAELVARVGAGAGALVVTEEALTPPGVSGLLTALTEQPSWSDLPIVLLLTGDDAAAPHVRTLTSSRNVTVLERPPPAVTLVTAVSAALRARHRQYEVRDLLARERAAREQAEAATRIKDEFLATVTHELRTPLSAILISAHLLEAGRLTGEAAARALHAITANAELQSRLIEDLLDTSRMLTGRLRIDAEPRALAPMLRDAAEVVRPMAEAKSVRLVVDIQAEEATVLADAARIQQIVWNLLSNAVKFTPAGGSVTLRQARAGDEATVSVSDTGEGIDPELLPHVFERFRRGDPGLTRREAGLGLGLAIVKQLVELHGGTVQATSAGPGQGATFTVRLPLRPAVDAAPAAPPLSEAAQASLAGVRVLLVEDDADMRLALMLVLQDAGLDVVAVESASAALAVLVASATTRPPRVVVSDLRTLADNHALARALRAAERRAATPPVVAIALGSEGGDEARRLALEAGFDLQLATPLGPGALQAAIHTLIHGP